MRCPSFSALAAVRRQPESHVDGTSANGHPWTFGQGRVSIGVWAIHRCPWSCAGTGTLGRGYVVTLEDHSLADCAAAVARPNTDRARDHASKRPGARAGGTCPTSTMACSGLPPDGSVLSRSSTSTLDEASRGGDFGVGPAGGYGLHGRCAAEAALGNVQDCHWPPQEVAAKMPRTWRTMRRRTALGVRLRRCLFLMDVMVACVQEDCDRQGLAPPQPFKRGLPQG